MKLFRHHREDRQEHVVDEHQFERVRLVGVPCHQHGEDFHVFTDSVGADGLRFISQVSVMEGNEVLLYLPVEPGRQRAAVRARVTWVRTEGERQFTGGVEFLDLTDEQRVHWAGFVALNREDDETPAQDS